MDYLSGYRRMLLDMHIPDWDPSFLSRYDPAHVASLYERAGLTSVMFYCNSHAGLTYWPTDVMHPGLGGRDVVGELLEAVHAKGIAACAYYSVVFDNRTVLDHPQWWVSPVMAGGGGPGLEASPLLRYGVCCPNNPDYVAFTKARIEDLLTCYEFDCLFYDMTFRPAVCSCAHCRERFGGDPPATVDWMAPDWCAFQSFRERSIVEFVRTIVGYAKAVRPDMPVYNNFALAVANWWPGFPFAVAEEVDFTGGDMYGDAVEQLVVSKLMLNLTRRRPAEFMTSLCVNLRDHVRLKDPEQLRMQAFAGTALGSAVLFIDAIDPDGGTNDAVYDTIGAIFASTAPFEPFLGGTAVEDVAVYHSSESRMSFDENGTPLGGRPSAYTPHQDAVREACRALQRAHIPFGVITRRQLGDLARYRVVVLPTVLRMDAEECAAFRVYVRGGGRLYASRWTSLTETRGERLPDFALADVFGCHYDGEERGYAFYVRPGDEAIGRWIEPQHALSHMGPMAGMASAPTIVRVPALRAGPGRVLATLVVPYGHPEPGSVFDRNWSSIHSFPPHIDTGRPAIVEHDGCIYSCVDADERVFVGLVRRLLGEDPSFTADAHPAVWLNAFEGDGRVVVTFLNYQADLPPVPTGPIPLTLAGSFASLALAPSLDPVPFEIRDGRLHAQLDRLDTFAMVVATR